MKRRCPRCDQEKSVSDFNRKTKDLYQTYCRSCDNAHKREHYQKNKQYYVDKAQYHKNQAKLKYEQYKIENPCTDCGGHFHFAAMHFDHLPEFEKLMEVSALVHKTGQNLLQKEMDKCELVCANCHAVRTWTRKHREEIEKPSLRSSVG